MAKDLKLVNNDLFINSVTGDFEITDSKFQNIEDIVNAFPGWWKEVPPMGVGIMAYDKSSGKRQELESKIRKYLQMDNFDDIRKLVSSQDPEGICKVDIDAYRTPKA